MPKCPKSDDIKNMRDVMLEAVASVDEALMEKYFAGEEFDAAEIKVGACRRYAVG